METTNNTNNKYLKIKFNPEDYSPHELDRHYNNLFEQCMKGLKEEYLEPLNYSDLSTQQFDKDQTYLLMKKSAPPMVIRTGKPSWLREMNFMINKPRLRQPNLDHFTYQIGCNKVLHLSAIMVDYKSRYQQYFLLHIYKSNFKSESQSQSSKSSNKKSSPKMNNNNNNLPQKDIITIQDKNQSFGVGNNCVYADNNNNYVNDEYISYERQDELEQKISPVSINSDSTLENNHFQTQPQPIKQIKQQQKKQNLSSQPSYFSSEHSKDIQKLKDFKSIKQELDDEELSNGSSFISSQNHFHSNNFEMNKKKTKLIDIYNHKKQKIDFQDDYNGNNYDDDNQNNNNYYQKNQQNYEYSRDDQTTNPLNYDNNIKQITNNKNNIEDETAYYKLKLRELKSQLYFEQDNNRQLRQDNKCFQEMIRLLDGRIKKSQKENEYIKSLIQGYRDQIQKLTSDYDRFNLSQNNNI